MSLAGRKLSLSRGDGSELTDIADAAAMQAVLAGHFGLAFTAEEAAVLFAFAGD